MVFLFLLGPAIYIGTYIAEQHLARRARRRPNFRAGVAEQLTREWREKTGTELPYVAGTEFAANNVAVYSPDRPHVVVHGRPQISPWIDMNDLRKRGVLVLWEEGLPAAHVDEWRDRFGAQGEPGVLEFPRQTRRHGSSR